MSRILLPSLALIVALASTVAPARAQDRSPALRQTLVDLAYVLGESHALRQACQGADDQYWRTRMIKLVDTEQPDAALERRLKESFNTGFATRQSEFPTCTPAARKAAASVAGHGREIADGLAKVMNEVRRAPPEAGAEGAPPTEAPR